MSILESALAALGGGTLGTVLDAALSDPRVTVGSIVVAVLSFAGLIGREWIRKAKHARNNERMIAQAKIEADVAVKVAEIEAAPTLIDKLNQLWERKDECEQTLVKERDARQQERLADADACKQETARQVEAHTAPLRDQLARMVATTADARERDRGEDTTVTRLRDLAAEVRRSPTPPGGMPAQSDPVPAAPRREIPPPRRGGPKET